MILLDSLNITLRIIEIIAACYAILIGLFTYGWFGLKESNDFDLSKKTSVSVLVAARNEIDTIACLIADLMNQDYPKQLYEVIIVDDHSDDGTYARVRDVCAHYDSKNIVLLQASGHGKKAAIDQALFEAKGDFILVTDADCRLSPNWIRCMVSYYEKKQPKMILGPVLLAPSKSFFECFQTIEHLSLIGSTAGATAISIPIMCNGANMAYEKTAALKAAVLRNDAHLSSGDDVFLMQAMVKTFGAKSVQFIRNKHCVVTTAPSKTIDEFFKQRARWVSKSKGYASLSIIATAFIVFLFSLSLTVLFFLSFFEPTRWFFVLLFLLFKTIIDFPLLYGICDFMKQRKLIRLLIPLEIVYPFYVVLSVILGLFGKSFWKGRKVNESIK